MILIYPPVIQPGEAPAGLARLKAALDAQGVPCTVVDANLEGLLWLMSRPLEAKDRWTKRALAHLPQHIQALRGEASFGNIDQYKSIVNDINRVVERAGQAAGVRVGLNNFQSQRWSPLQSAHLLEASEEPEANPFAPYFRERLLPLVEREASGLVGVSITTLSQALCAFALVGLLHRELPGVRIILGGGLITSWMRGPHWHDSFRGLVERCVAGEGEGALLALAGKEPPGERWYRPDYSAFPLTHYLSPGVILPYSASQGCCWRRCTFCPERAENNPFCPVPGRQVRADLEALAGRMAPRLIHFLDNAITPALLPVLTADPLPAPWYGYLRFTPHLEDEGVCHDLRRSGCTMVQLGLESGDQGVLDRLEKGIELEGVSRSLVNLRRAGIVTYVYLLFGTPAEGPAEALKTMEFVVRHRDEIGFINPALFNMPLCCPEASGLATREFYQGDLSLYTDFAHPLGWDRGRVRHFLDREFRRHPVVAGILQLTPPYFTSNHGAFFRRVLR